MNIEHLKTLVMEQAREKGFGTTLSEINAPEKFILICTEGIEVRDVEEESKVLLDDIAKFGESYSMNPPYAGSFDAHPGVQLACKTADNRHHYREEWGDVLQRTLHLGGCFGMTFSLQQFDSLPPPWSDARYRKLYEMTIEAYTHYRKMSKEPQRKELMEHKLNDIASYCIAVAKSELFDIESAILLKIGANKERVWGGYNEKIVKKL